MAKISFTPSDFKRSVADESSLFLRNRFLEANPSLSEAGAAMIARPGMKKWTEVGAGPIKGIYSQSGVFGGNLFVASGEELYRVTQDKTQTVIMTNMYPGCRQVNMAITSPIESVPAYLFFADGRNLFVYDGTTVEPVVIPGDYGAIDVAVVNSFVIVVPVQEGEMIGRFYWIEPGEKVIDELNWATAERSADGLFGVRVMGDQFYLPGPQTTEVWYVTGDQEAPVRRLQGVVFDRGTWENTAVAAYEDLIVCDAEGGVFIISGGRPERVSTPSIEEQIRLAIQKQQRFDI